MGGTEVVITAMVTRYIGACERARPLLPGKVRVIAWDRAIQG
jgi:hypothetical protein